MVARSFGLVWTLNPLQIVYVDNGIKPPPHASTEPHVELAPSRESREGGGESVRVGRRHERARVRPAERGGGSEEEGVSGTDRGKRRFAYGHGTLKGHLLVRALLQDAIFPISRTEWMSALNRSDCVAKEMHFLLNGLCPFAALWIFKAYFVRAAVCMIDVACLMPGQVVWSRHWLSRYCRQ